MMALRKCKACGRTIRKKTKKCSNCGALLAKRTSFLPWIITIIIIGYLVGHFSDNIKSFVVNPTKDTAMNNVNVDIMWSSSSGNVTKADLTINNNSQYDIKDLEVICTHYDINGSRVSGKDLTINEAIPANSQKDINDFNLGIKHPQIEQTECIVSDLQVM